MPPKKEPAPLNKELVERGLVAEFKGITSEGLVRQLYTMQEAIVDFARLCSGANTGQQISMLFNPHRYATPTRNSISIIDAFNTHPTFAKGVARALAWCDGTCNDRTLLNKVLMLGINGIQYVNEFPPFVARDILCDTNATSMLDPCAGWGGRMLGAAAAGVRYLGYEPCTTTFQGLLRLRDWILTLQPNFQCIVVNKPFEDADISGHYDVALTSPPYFDTEKYSTEDTQAAVKYNTYDSFLNGFFNPMLDKAFTHATIAVINVGSRKYDLEAAILARYHGTTILGAQLGANISGVRDNSKKGEYFYKLAK